jgi:KaiC/GvpD/RAD55 family RecA-like ATPase
MSKELRDDYARVERYEYLIERLEYSVNNPTIPTGIQELDDILYGGIPSGYSILLTSPPLDEKDLLLETFLLQGLKQGETILLISTMLKEKSSRFVENNQDKFYLILISPWADNIIQDMPNILKFHSLDDLTQLNISLKVFLREIMEKGDTINRVVLEPLSEALLMHETRVVRRWLRDLLTMFNQLNATTLSILDPGMHSTGESRIITDLFNGHFDIEEKRVENTTKKILNVKRLYNKKYQKKDLEIHPH